MEVAFAGSFYTPEEELIAKLGQVKAWVFDWDGVFHSGQKDSQGNSSFSEVDSMGLNLLRYGTYLQNGAMPLSIILTGMNNPTAAYFAEREHFDALFMGFRDKSHALNYICEQHQLAPYEVGFVFDDVLDFNVAKEVGVRFAVPHSAAPMTHDFMAHNGLVDYACAHAGGHGALREMAELSLVLMGQFDTVVEDRTAFNQAYTNYWEARQAIATAQFVPDAQGAPVRR